MIKLELKTERNMKDYPYLETPIEWMSTVCDMIDEVNSILSAYNLPRKMVEYMQIKQKFENELRVYYSLPILLEEGLSYEDELTYRTLDNIISSIVDKYEKLIKYKIENKLF